MEATVVYASKTLSIPRAEGQTFNAITRKTAENLGILKQ
jgi:hypothetical protein